MNPPRRLLLAFALVILVSLQASAAEDGLPPDLPLPASPASTEPWLRDANLLQPYGHSQYVDVTRLGDRPAALQREFGFNGIVLQPPDSHNVTSVPKENLTEEQFAAALDAYRKAGWKIILYTSLTGFGYTKEFASGQVAKEHPDWSQRDPKGNPIMVYGAPWLCPNTGARQAALDRAVNLVRTYHPDGVLLDNNQFFFAKDGWTCHCDGCTKAFRQYVAKRFEAEQSRKLFGSPPQELLIPTDDGPLKALWMKWRNRVLAEVNEEYREKLRETDPKIVFFANTQYLYDDGDLASDDQFEREDIVISESVGLNGPAMARKMILGQCLASGRPLWNYIGTFTEGNNYTGLKPAAEILPMIAATLAHGARPWIVDGFNEGASDAAARKEMSRLLAWHAAHEDLYRGQPWAGVASLVSLNSRNVLHRPLIPPHWSAMQTTGTPVIALRDDELTAEKLKPFSFLTVETAACLSEESADVIAHWVRDGGTLIAAPDVGAFDDLGRKRPTSPLWQKLGLDAPPQSLTAAGRGKVLTPPTAQFAAAITRTCESASFHTDAEVVAYHEGPSLLLHVLATDKHVDLTLPAALGSSASTSELFVPGTDRPTTVPITDRRLSFDMPAQYVVIRIR